ncbi:MAG: hypothetical protein ACTHKL_24090 [Streptosporangiaceae bacterium]
MTYSLWVWSTVRATRVTVTTTSSARSMKSPAFTMCPTPRMNRCTIRTLPANQAFELRLTDQVRKTATAGAPMTLTVSVQSGALSPAEATVTTFVSRRVHSPGGGSVPPLPPLPPTTLQPFPSATITPPSLGGLFPTVTPTASPSASQNGKTSGKATRVEQTSSALPLDPRLIGGQLAGLAVLAAAITMVVARLSLRTPQPAGPQPASPAPKPEAAAAEDETGDDKPDQPAS